VQLVRESFREHAALDIAVSHALLREVSEGERPATARLYRPAPTLAFGKLDALDDGFEEACERAARRGFAPVIRLAGGRAAAYDEGSLVYEEIRPGKDLMGGLHDRFRDTTAMLARALERAGADARVGSLPGEYCAGEYSVNVGGRVKVVGTAQRVVRGASLLSAGIVGALVDVYDALAVEWDPATAGALEMDVADVEEAVLAEAGPAEEVDITERTLRRAQTLRKHHVAPR
jgi:octanoyl-[GcvH]:protein N-octanoyltransferase